MGRRPSRRTSTTRRDWRGESPTFDGPPAAGAAERHAEEPVRGGGDAAGGAPGAAPVLAESKSEARLVVAGTSGLVNDEYLNQSRTNQALVLNIADWLVLDPAMLAMRSRGMQLATLKPDVSDGTRNLVKFGNGLGLRCCWRCSGWCGGACARRASLGRAALTLHPFTSTMKRSTVIAVAVFAVLLIAWFAHAGPGERGHSPLRAGPGHGRRDPGNQRHRAGGMPATGKVTLVLRKAGTAWTVESSKRAGKPWPADPNVAQQLASALVVDLKAPDFITARPEKLAELSLDDEGHRDQAPRRELVIGRPRRTAAATCAARGPTTCT